MNKFTKKSRWMIYLSLFISGVVVFSTVFYIIAARDSANDQKKSMALVIIIIIAILAVVSMIYSRMKLRRSTKNLSSEYAQTYEEIADKLNGLSMSNLEKKETLTDILDLFLLADKDNRNVDDVIGSDIDEFVNQIHESFGYRSKFVFNFLTGIQYSVLYIFMMQGAELLKSERIGFFNQQISISLFVQLIPLAFLGVPLMVHFIRKNKLGWVVLIPVIMMGLFIAAMETLNAYFISSPWVYTLLEGNANLFPNVSILSVWLLVLLATSILKIVQRKISVKKL